ncbi:replicative DNA helicase [Amycolatopsis japonica]|uniref:replicative DNA helicase n=1 Tax=Amycolatopsis japonica TaxID=208439 RepID=UPI00366FDB88
MSTDMISYSPADDDYASQPPHNNSAEQVVLGGLMETRNAAVISEVTGLISSADFYRPAHAAIFDAILDLFNDGKPHDAMVVADELSNRGELSRVGGALYLHSLVAVLHTSDAVAHHAEKVRDKATLRRAYEAGTRTAQAALEANKSGGDPAELLTRAQSFLDQVSDGHQNGGQALIGDLRADFCSYLDDVQSGRVKPGLSTGYVDLDAVTNGLHPGHLIIVAARPGIGKTSLAKDLSRAAAIKQGVPTAFFSLEMSRTELVQGIVAAETPLRISDMREPGSLTPADWDRMNKAWDKRISGAPLTIDDTPNMTVTDIRAKARMLHAKPEGLGLIVVDYLQLLTAGGRAESRQVEVSEMSRSLKLLAKELEVPVVALSQLNRGPEQRQDKRPLLSDLRESGSLEQDADMVILLSRPDAHDRDDPRAGEADFIVAKNRFGPTATVTVAHQLHYGRFVDLSRL